jgi:hypothetical protein
MCAGLVERGLRQPHRARCDIQSRPVERVHHPDEPRALSTDAAVLGQEDVL